MPTKVATSVNEGRLVFVFDTGDPLNSYLGEPTTNFETYQADPVNLTGFSWGWTTTSVGWYHGKYCLKCRVVSPGNNPNWTGAYSGIGLTTVAGQVYTRSCELFVEPGGDHAWTPNVNATHGGTGGSNAHYNMSALGTWQKLQASVTATGTNTPFYYYWFARGANDPQNVDFTVYLYHPQLENKTYATAFTPSSRTSTTGLKDLTSNYTIDLNTVSFNSNGALLFDGTDDRVDLGSLSDLFIPGAKAITVEAVFKITPGASGNDAPIFENYRFNFWYSYSNDKINGYVRTGAPDTAGYQTATGHTSTIACSSKGNYNHVVMMYETIGATEGRITMYVNGQYAGSSEGLRMGPYPLYPTWIGQSNHGGYGTFKLNGQVEVMRVYNGRLLESEILNNYNHLKTRFNIE